MLYPSELRGRASRRPRSAIHIFGRPAGLPAGGKPAYGLGGHPGQTLKSDKAMKLGGEPSNWIGLGLLLFLIAAISLGVHWLNLPKPPV